MKDAIELIDRGLNGYEAEYSLSNTNGISNHLPMSLLALWWLGADLKRLKHFYEWYVTRLRARRFNSTFTITDENWLEFFGRHSENHALYRFFNKELQKSGVEKVLSKYVPALSKGVCGGAFHPLIRLAYAIEASYEPEIAEALSSWVMAYLPLGDLDDFLDGKPQETIAQFQALALPVDLFKADSIFERVQNVGDHYEFRTHIRISKTVNLQELAEFSLAAYLAKPSFAILHMVTATHAARIVSRYIDQQSEFLNYFWIALMATFVSEGSPSFSESNSISFKPWEELVKIAIDANDDHKCKFVYTCMKEAEHYDNKLFQMAATIKCQGS